MSYYKEQDAKLSEFIQSLRELEKAYEDTKFKSDRITWSDAWGSAFTGLTAVSSILITMRILAESAQERYRAKHKLWSTEPTDELEEETKNEES